MPIGKKAPTYRDVYRLPIFNGLFVCLSVVCCLSVFFRTIIDCESCMWPISTNPASEETGELGLMRAACFVVSRLELAAVSVVLRFWWCVLSAAGFRFFFVLLSS